MRYNAFISYRHLPTDKFVAENLHKRLETYKLPKSLYGKCEKHTIERVFRDRDELPLSSNLSDPIDEAIRESEFLIVICTPKLKESRWCLREIETFKAVHGRDKIFVVLAEGEPNESFPQELLTEEYEEIDENGNVVNKTRIMEPLAADVRAKNNHERKKKIKEESLRLIAPMLGLNYDDLKQRHRERQVKKIILLSSIITTVFLIFGIVSTSMAVAINRQNIEIKRNYAESLAKESEILFGQGNLYEAREKAEQAVDYADSELANHALDVAYGKNAAIGYYRLTDCLDMPDGVVGLTQSPNKQYLAMSDGLNRVVLLDIETGKRMKAANSAVTFSEGYYGFIDDCKFLYNNELGVVLYDPSNKDEEIINSIFSLIEISDDKSKFACLNYTGINLFDSKSLECIHEISFENELNSVVDFSADSTLLACATSNDDMNTGTVSVIDTVSGKIVARNSFEGGVPLGITVKKDGYVLALCDVDNDNETSDNRLSRYDMEGNLTWTTEDEELVYGMVDYCDAGENKVFAYQSNLLTIWDDRTGKLIEREIITGHIIKCQREETGRYIISLAEGYVLDYHAADMTSKEAVNFDVVPTLDIAESVYDNNAFYVHFRGADYISVYTVPETEKKEVISNNSYTYVPTSDEVMFGDAIARNYQYDETIIRPDDEQGSMMIVSANKQYLAFYGGEKEVRVYESGSEQPMYALPINTAIINYILFSEDCGWIVANYQNGDVEIYDVTTGEHVKTLEKEYPFVFDVINLPGADSVIIDCASETRILDSNFNVRTTYQKTGDSMCVGCNMAEEKILLKSGEEMMAISLE